MTSSPGIISFNDAVRHVVAALHKAKPVLTSRAPLTSETFLWSRDERHCSSAEIDSMDFVEVILELEDCYGVEIPEEDIDIYEIETIGDLAKIIVKRAECSE